MSKKDTKGEAAIAAYLDAHQYPYEREERWDDICDGVNFIRMDFTVYKFENNHQYPFFIIEFDGEQHFKLVNKEIVSVLNLFKIYHHDIAKNILCEMMRIPLIRIKHNQINIISDLLDDAFDNREFYKTNHSKEAWDSYYDQTKEALTEFTELFDRESIENLESEVRNEMCHE